MKCNAFESHADMSQIYLGNSLYTGNKPSNAKVNQLVKAVEKYTLANHIFWGLWGLISVSFFFLRLLFHDYPKSLTCACQYYQGILIQMLCVYMQSYVNKIDFDYKEYARQRFQQYWLRKPTLLDSPSIVSQDENVNGSLTSFT